MKIQAKDLSVGDVIVGKGYFTFGLNFIVREITIAEEKVSINCQQEDGLKRKIETSFCRDQWIEIDKLNMN